MNKKFLKYAQVLFMIAVFGICLIREPIYKLCNLNFSLNKNEETAIESSVNGLDFNMPVEVQGVCENQDGYIEITTIEKSFVRAPIDCFVEIIEKDRMKGLKIEKLGYCCYALGFDVISVGDKSYVKSGSFLGSIKTNKLYVKIYKNENRVSLKTIRKMFNV